MLDLLFLPYSKASLRGESVYLRAPRPRDQKQWVDIRRISRDFLQPWEPTWPEDGAEPKAFRRRLKHFSEDWRSGDAYPFFIFHRNRNDLLGGVTLSNIRRGVTQAATIGYWMGYPYIRRGHMAEAVNLVLDYAFENLRLHRVEAACLIHNEPSRRLLLNLGFHEEGLARQYLCINGQWQDHRIFGILGSDRPSKN